MRTLDRPGHGWTVVLRRQPARIVDGEPEGGYTDAFEIICCHCGDDPDLDYRDVSPELRRIRGPYPVAAGVAAYKKHVGWHDQLARATPAGTMTRCRGRALTSLPGRDDAAARGQHGRYPAVGAGTRSAAGG
jgi:hypothetical protein